MTNRYPHPELLQSDPSLLKASIETGLPPSQFNQSVCHFNNNKKNVQIQQKECRICLQTQKQAPQKIMLRPCSCTGSVEYVHEECMVQWIKTVLKGKNRVEQNKIIDKGISCQLCHMNIQFQFNHHIECRNSSEIVENAQARSGFFIAVLVLILVQIIGMSASAIFVSSKIGQFFNGIQVQFQVVLAFSGMVLLSLGFLITTVGVFYQFFFKNIVKIGKIKAKNSRNKSSFSRNRIFNSYDSQN